MSLRPRRTRHRVPTWLQWIGQTLSFGFLCVSALAAIVLIIIPLVSGSQTYSVLTNSMAPSYPAGTFLVVKPTPADALQVGDVITFQMESGRPEVITHRITALTAGQNGERLLITQGDNNDEVDPQPVQDIQVRGTLMYAVPYVGFLASALGQTDRGGMITALAVALIAFGAVTMIRGAIHHRRETRDGVLITGASDALDASVTTPAAEYAVDPDRTEKVHR
ncbi:signal peptidase I [Citricoccus sp.]|uniref:signal peptidase I n=1 Tax=Citricoccus sp. TaxID=1978372 RepID=UPI0028BD69EC|nr:signal peptidase I [Citricoccus sp.]